MLRTKTVALVTHSELLRHTAQAALHSEGHDAKVFHTLPECLESWKQSRFDAVILDVSSRPPRDEASLAELVRLVGREQVWIALPLGLSPWTADADSLGLKNRLTAPLQRTALELVLSDLSSPRHESPAPAISEPRRHSASGLILEELGNNRYFLAASQKMMQIYETVLLLAAVDAPVLILGESGSGKDVVANLLHRHSKRAGHTFTSVNCAALPPDLLESELFGYEAGAFTGAVRAKSGKFEQADKGTILLDEIGEMSAPMQAKLLHVLQDGQYSRLGARAPSMADVRVVSATNVDIETAMADKLFREDLYYRISTFTIRVPPLRERREEIPYLVEEMVKRQAAIFQRDPVYISPHILSTLQEYDWPGNLRELSNVVIRLQVLQGHESSIADIERKLSRTTIVEKVCPVEAPDGRASVHEMRSIVKTFKDQTERRLIQQALDNARWNRRQAAVELRISYRTLLYKIDEYHLKETRAPIRMNGEIEGTARFLA
ncbi:response regulator with CheY-like receiver, AAA-type ATPase, and DNA-binding domains [Terriglobus roseus DSM 18391]|uniref:Response regulator with CheY-like receiver, AAA-type ATPase, and DNA-binding domains n=1 Tax=Terriglobus roseus (strain DSM 18391 / NRRL B-41598 / KBS 63) TaxID=926566 RepID=I3ZEA9_TERRK|nr:sigma-54 dependent transcriptional regulator [Terriglobus roseus]AFL87577.1 response regulator with CheY-like receiver, AAA-type ATPase, and DNA-binding domains [Terriglobus roseus DSM 18391]